MKHHKQAEESWSNKTEVKQNGQPNIKYLASHLNVGRNTFTKNPTGCFVSTVSKDEYLFVRV